MSEGDVGSGDDAGPGERSYAAELSTSERRAAVRDRYADVAAGGEGCCGPAADCGEGSPDLAVRTEQLGYSADDVAAVGEGANLGLGCGNPTAIASLREGERVLDLGAGAGFDCLLAAREVGPEGHVVGVDMTPEMVERARANADEGGYEGVEFRLGEIEHLPVADASVDVVISNCVVNLSPAKEQVFHEAFRALAPGGRLAISDVVRTAPFPDDLRVDPDAYSRCAAGAEPIEVIEALLGAAGFVDVAVEPKDESAEFIREWDDERPLEEYLVAATIEARKPDA